AGEALQSAGIAGVGLANNVNYGAAAIRGSLARLDRLGIRHTGAGPDLAAARAPAIADCGELRVGFLQRSSVYWPTDHEATAKGCGIAVIRGHTAYQLPAHKTHPDIPPMNRPGIPPIVVTWADREYLAAFTEDIAALRRARTRRAHSWSLFAPEPGAICLSLSASSGTLSARFSAYPISRLSAFRLTPTRASVRKTSSHSRPSGMASCSARTLRPIGAASGFLGRCRRGPICGTPASASFSSRQPAMRSRAGASATPV